MINLKTKISYTLYILLALVLFTSCSIKAEEDFNRKRWELKQKTIELEYLEELYRIKRTIKTDAYIKKIDSLILVEHINESSN